MSTAFIAKIRDLKLQECDLQIQHHVQAECNWYTCGKLIRLIFISSLGDSLQTNPFSLCGRKIGRSQDINLFDEGLQFWISKGIKEFIRERCLSHLSPCFCKTLLLQICQHLCKTSDKNIREEQQNCNLQHFLFKMLMNQY